MAFLKNYMKTTSHRRLDQKCFSFKGICICCSLWPSHSSSRVSALIPSSLKILPKHHLLSALSLKILFIFLISFISTLFPFSSFPFLFPHHTYHLSTYYIIYLFFVLLTDATQVPKTTPSTVLMFNKYLLINWMNKCFATRVLLSPTLPYRICVWAFIFWNMWYSIIFL